MDNTHEFSQAVKAGKVVAIDEGNLRLWCCSARDEDQVAMTKAHLGVPKNEGANIWVDNDGRLNQHMKDVSEAAWDVFDATDGEITLILPQAKNLANSALFSDQSAAITFVKEQWVRQMMQWIKAPLAVFKSQKGKEDIPANLLANLYVLNLPAQINESLVLGYSIIKLSADGEIKIIRSQGQRLMPHI